MKVFFNINLGREETAWTAKNGSNKKILQVINKTGLKIKSNQMVECELGWLDKPNRSFLIITRCKNKDKRYRGVFLNKAFGFSTDIPSVKEATSEGSSSGSREYKMAVLVIETEIQVFTFMDINGGDIYKLSSKGFDLINIYEKEYSEIEIL